MEWDIKGKPLYPQADLLGLILTVMVAEAIVYMRLWPTDSPTALPEVLFLWAQEQFSLLWLLKIAS